MIKNSVSSKPELLRTKNLKELRRLLSLKGNFSEEEVIQIWQHLKKMQDELELPSLYPIKQHYHFYQKLQEIRKSLDFTSLDFVQLNQLYNEITALRELLGLPETTPISKIISMIRKVTLERLASLEVKPDSLLLKILLIHSTANDKDLILDQDKLPLTHDLDLILFEVLKAYGPLSRSELVQLTKTPRSTIYDSLQRLEANGFTVQFTEKKNPVGRPVTLYDALI